ncbi:FumA C-terminus/TtdB family hydratase beta subunit [Papillibacter cinnamivorans]|uniref:Fumarate hydratase subunit beta n=1 Tax=Papillibacter cinnamivorans DSM 12816 TaxID=1122930 RepID=A0A1W1Z2B3_9FIRM|nr:FumA C-terminus/TtdB family hydratase beta subunit [Papillibacter cinnamivorans]SMC42617.1 fumarate hydratase subunit beta [Papillibacter cinnamivorans DSM 12816]
MSSSVIALDTGGLREQLGSLRAGDRVSLSGTVYTARDAAHKMLFQLLDEGAPLPFPLKDAVIYYAGPTPAKPGMAVGSCGPTTSGRMDPYAPRLLSLGLAAMIGKGERSEAVAEAIREYGAAYFCAVGGAGALIARHIRSAEEIAFPALGCESVKRMQVDCLPLIVAIDCNGGNLFQTGRKQWAK